MLFAIPSLRAGGAERVFTTVLKHIDRGGFDASLVVFDGRDALLRGELPNDLEVIDLRASRVRAGLGAFLGLLRKRRPDVVVSTLEHLNKALCATRLLWPSGTRHVVRLTHVLHLDRAPARIQARLLYRRAEAVVFQSPAMRADYEARLGCALPNGVTIENPVDLAAIARASRLPMDGGRLFERDAINLVTAGPFEPRKGFDLLVKAMARSDPRLHLTILGAGPGRDELVALAAGLGLSSRVRIAGIKASPFPFFAAADAYVLASRTEGSPNAVFEAIACATPVIATPVAGLDAWLPNVAGCRVATEISEFGLAAALDAFCASPRLRPSPTALERQDAPLIARRWEDLIGGTARKRRESQGGSARSACQLVQS